MNNNKFLIAATILAALAVALGAFGAHGLKQIVTPEKVEVFKTGVQYQFYHAIAIALAVIVSQFIDSPWLKRSANCFSLGILFFSGSLYLLTFFAATNTEGSKWVGAITPIGGVFFLLGWIFLTIAIYKNKKLI
jgi:uncharacterized membrane protein YgdD (TMEM256/DUF423 family)